MKVTDFYDHITFRIPKDKQISQLMLTQLTLSEDYDIIYKIQRDTSGVYDTFNDYIFGTFNSSTQLNIDITPLHYELKGGWQDVSGTNYAILFYLHEINSDSQTIQ